MQTDDAGKTLVNDLGSLDNFNVADPELFRADSWRPYFAQLRDQAPVHYCKDSHFGPYWSISTYELIMQVREVL